MVDLLVVAAVVTAIILPFLIVPEMAERLGYRPRSARVRALVWSIFVAIVFIPALVFARSFLFTSSAADWLLLIAAMAVAILYDYYRLNPDRVHWSRRSQ